MATLTLVRHGQSQWNLENRFTGWQDIDLTDIGRQEALQAGIQLKGQKIDIAFTSVLQRAQHTLDIILHECGLEHLEVIKNKALNERGYGQLEGLNKTDTAEKYGEEQVHLWRRSYDVPPPGGESLKDTYNRVVPYFLHEMLPHLEKGENVLVVAHGNSLRALIKFLDNLDEAQILNMEIATGVPHAYEMDDTAIQALKARDPEKKTE